jgi:ABC-type multidrug transport system ATPase subunit
MQRIVSVQHLSKQFKNLTAVKDLSFSVNEGDVYGFLGQNGAGKSTTIRMLLTLIQPTTGDIEIFGLNLKNHRKEILRNIGAVIEKPDTYKYLTAFENLKLFAELSGVSLPKQQLMQQLEMVGLADRAKDKVGTFSQGMKQRLGIGIALVHNPQLIVLDEPTNGLDPQGIADIRNLILHLSKDLHKTLIISSHLLNEIEQIATKVLIIDKGKKIVEDSANNLFDPSQTIVDIKTTDDTKATEILNKSDWNNYLLKERANELVFKLNKKNIPQLVDFLVSRNIELLSLQPRHSLEDYFLQVTSGKQHVDTFKN